MLAIPRMAVIRFFTEIIIKIMSDYYSHYCGDQQPVLQVMPVLLGEQQRYACQENIQRQEVVMVLPIAMRQRYRTDEHGQEDHEIFERNVVYNINAEQRKAGKHQRQHGAMYSAGQRGGDPQCVPIYFYSHSERQIYINCNFVARKSY